MSNTSIPSKTVLQLWVRAGGRCEFPGCNRQLFRDDLTLRQMNTAYVAHIVADQPDGPRGDPTLSPKFAKDIGNLMLLCDACHRRIDNQVDDYPVEILNGYKRNHEARIEFLTNIDQNRKTCLLFFTDNFGDRKHAFDSGPARAVVLSGRYPSEPRPIEIDLTSSPYRDDEPSYFDNKQEDVRRRIATQVRERIRINDITHLSIFGMAGIPLLAHLGYEIGDTIPTDLYQFHRDTDSWNWQPALEQHQRYIIDWPDAADVASKKNVVINLSLSGVIHPDEIAVALPNVPFCSYKMTIPFPNRDHLKSREQLEMFADQMRTLLARIREVHGADCCIHVFPAVPAPVAIKLGQLLLPKTDPTIRIYDHHKNSGGFRYALTIPPRRSG